MLGSLRLKSCLPLRCWGLRSISIGVVSRIWLTGLLFATLFVNLLGRTERSSIWVSFCRFLRGLTTYLKWPSRPIWPVGFFSILSDAILSIISAFWTQISHPCILPPTSYPACQYNIQFHASNDSTTALRKVYHLEISITLYHDAYYFSITLYKLPHSHIYKHHSQTFCLLTSYLNKSLLLNWYGDFQIFSKYLDHVLSSSH